MMAGFDGIYLNGNKHATKNVEEQSRELYRDLYT